LGHQSKALHGLHLIDEEDDGDDFWRANEVHDDDAGDQFLSPLLLI